MRKSIRKPIVKRAGRKTNSIHRPVRIDEYLIAPSLEPRFNQALRIDGESILALGDLQFPFHESGWVNRCLKLAFAWKIKTLVLAGDILDLHGFSIFLAQHKDPNSELKQDQLYLDQLVSGFHKVYWLWGNHEERFKKRLEMWMDAEWVARMVGADKKIEVSNYFWCDVGSDWRLEHPGNISVIAASALREIAEKYRKNVAGWHSHLVGEQWTRDGKFIAMDVGMCADEGLMEYTSIRHNRRPAMKRGGLILRWDGEQYFAHRLNEQTDFELLMKAEI